MTQRRRLLTRSAALVGGLALVLVAAMAALGVHDEEFQLEGNATAGDLTYVDLDLVGDPPKSTEIPGTLGGEFAGDFDWDSLFDNTGPGGTGNEKALPAGFTGSDFILDFKSNGTTFITSDDTTFATGSKDTLQISTGWECNQDNNVNSKTDIMNGYAALYEGSGDDIFYFGLEKDVDNGTNNVGLWLFQDPAVGCQYNVNGGAFSGNHVPGDLFIVSEFTRGGGVANIKAYEWVADIDTNTAGNQPGLDPNPIDDLVNGDCLDAAGNDRLCAVVNGKSITMPWKSADSSVINAPKVTPNFFEGGINLDEFPQFQNSCFTGFMLTTRSSQSLTATIFDYVLGDIDTCNPELALDKEPETGTHNVGDAFSWTLAVSNTGDGPADDATVSDTIPAGLTITGTPTVNPATGNSCSVNGQEVTCTVDVPAGGSVTITVPVQSTTAVFGTSTAGCVNVTNTGSVSVAGDTNAGDNSDSVLATICRPILSKTANATYRELHTWDVQKSVSPTPQDGFAGDVFDYTWDIDVTETVTSDTFGVTGSISVQNPSTALPMTVALSDELNDAGTTDATIVSCLNGTLAAGSVTVAAGATANCAYTVAPSGMTATLNTVSGVMNGITFTATAPLTWTPTIVNPTVSLDDDQKPSGFPMDISETTNDIQYGDQYTCSTDPGAYTNGSYVFTDVNTATLSAGGQVIDSDGATETITCYLPSIDKSATATYRELHSWTVEKSVDPASQDGFIGDVFSYEWTIVVDEIVTEDTFGVSGTITLVNPNPSDALSGPLSDQLTGGPAGTITGCTGTGVTFVGGIVTVPAGGTATCSYTAAPGNRDATANTATFTKNGVAYTDTVGLTWVPTIVNPEVTLDDSDKPSGFPQVVSGDTTVEYTAGYTCSTSKGAYTNGSYQFQDVNTATVSAGGVPLDEDDATETITCYVPSISKTAAGTYGETHNWSVTKSVSPESQDANIGDVVDYDWTVVVTESIVEDGFSVTGTITVANPNPSDALTAALADTLDDASAVTIGACTNGGSFAAGTLTVPAGTTTVCSYTAAPTTFNATLNTATLTKNSVDFTATDAVEWTPTITNPSVTIDDDQNGAWPTVISDGGTFPYDDGYTCSTDKGAYTNGTYTYTDPNTVTLKAGDVVLDSDDATATVDCYIPAVSKTAAGTYRELHRWTVEKTVDPASQNANAGDTVDFDWTVTVDETVTEDSFAVTGSITLHNPNPSDPMALALSDVLGDGTAAQITSCTGGTLASGTVTIAAGGTATCDYTAAPGTRSATSNTATATIAGVDFDASDTIEWTATVVDPEITLDDDQAGAGDLPTTVTEDGSWTYDDGYACSTNVADYNASGKYTYNESNTAVIRSGATELDDDTADTAVNCYIPQVSKAATGSFDRAWTWTIDKTATNGVDDAVITSLDLNPDQTFLVQYEVTVDASKTDGSFEVRGTIDVTNPNPSDPMTVDVTDHLGNPSADLAATQIACGSEDGDDLVVPAGQTIQCTYAFTGLTGVSAGDEGTNTAKVTMGLVEVTDGDGYTFAKDEETDECIDVDDSWFGVLGTVCAGDAPKTFTYDRLLGPFDSPDQCGENTIRNVADFITNDTGTTGDDNHTIVVTVHCDTGCTLTQGYWKTHSEYGPAPTDPNWDLLGDRDGDGIEEGADEDFFLSGQTWYEVFWTKPAGNVYYNLAKQYMAAVLNGVSGASTAAVNAELAQATALLEQYTPEQIGALKGKKAPRPAFVSLAGKLASYNEGLIGPGHCDEDRLSSREI